MSARTASNSRKRTPDSKLVEDLERRVEERTRQYDEINARYQHLLENVPIGIVEIGVDGNFISVNSAFATMLGYDSPKKLLDSTTDVAEQLYVNAEGRQRVIDGLNKNHPTAICESQIKHKDGDVIWVSEDLTVIYGSSGEISHYEAFVQNITDQIGPEHEPLQTHRFLSQASTLAKIGFWIMDHQSLKFSYWSEEMVRIYGVRPDGNREVPLIDNNEVLFYHEDRQRILKNFKAFQESGKQFEIEYRVVRPDGELCWVHEIGCGVEWRNGRCTKSYGTVQDITEQKAAGLALLESEERLRLIIKAVSAGGWDWDISTGEVILSDYWIESLGYKSSEVEHSIQFWEGMLHPDEREDVLAFVEDYLNGDPAMFRQEYRIRTKSGEYRWNLDQGQVIERDAAGKPLRMVGTATDVTEQHYIEEELDQSRARFQSIMDHSPSMIFLKDPEGRYQLANREFERVFKVPGADIIGKFPADTMLPDEVAVSSTRHDQEIIRTLKPSTIEETFSLEGREFTLLTSKFPILDKEQKLVGIGTIATDISERIKAESAMKQMEETMLRNERLVALGELTGTVAHELRNPLGAISSSIHVLQQKFAKQDSVIVKALDIANRGIKRCDTIITELLDFARARGLRIQLNNLEEWLNALLDEQLLPEDMTICRNIGTESTLIKFDPEAMRRAVINIIDNARQAMCENNSNQMVGVIKELMVSTRLAGDHIEIDFQDSGPGISSEDMVHVLEPLFSTRSFGTGLGLPTVQRIMEEHGGGLNIDSEPSRGTQVTLWLPCSDQKMETLKN